MHRPLRASHCPECNKCIENFDHHCFCIGSCIGKLNYKFYYFYIMSYTVLIAYIMGFGIKHLVILSKTFGFSNAVSHSPTTIIELVICLACGTFVFSLWLCHTILIARALTTDEYIHEKDENKLFHRGSIWRNFFHTLCTLTPPSREPENNVIV